MDPQLAASLWQQVWQGLRGSDTPLPTLHFHDFAAFPSAFAVSELASTSIGLAAQAAADLIASPAPVSVNMRLASRWFQHSFRPRNRAMPALWDAFAGDYAAADGWIRLHTNAPHHRAAMERVLGQHADRAALSRSVARWNKADLEQHLIDAGGCAAAMRSEAEWRQHPQGVAVAQAPLIAAIARPQGPPPDWRFPRARPLSGIKVLDLTRIIAGPVATRFLASLGATVLRLDPPGWEEPTLEEEMTSGKRCARLDLKSAEGREAFRRLLQQTDVLVHGYRADALEKLGFDAETRQSLAPGLVDVSLNAWGWQGPWRNRRGFDSLVQMGCGIAHQGMVWQGASTPTPLPVQALDHATGYLMAAAVLEGLRQRRQHLTGWHAQLSLARTALLLQQHPYAADARQTGIQPAPHDFLAPMEITPWGIGERLRAAAYLPGTALVCASAASPLGSSAPRW
ncbi:CoA transferase [Pantoea sp.]|uniref:CoA transferase n=1 Tax=Pantoea sp. TaxID=69393 RepID=UPI00289CD368|nr:CoA transferase [Pantoea sp.]